MKKAFIIIILVILYFTGFSFAENLGNTTIQSFNKAILLGFIRFNKINYM